jgi:WG containing repeat
MLDELFSLFKKRSQIRFVNRLFPFVIVLMLVVGTVMTFGGLVNMSMNLGDANVQSSETAKYLFINKAGKIVIDASGYESVGSFSEGLAAVLDPRKGWGFIDKTGAVVIQPRFESSASFRDGLAPVVLAGRWGFINRTGDLVIENQFEWVGGFSEGVAIVQRLPRTAKQNVAQLPVGRTVAETFTFSTDSSGSELPADNGEFLVIDKSGKTLVNLTEKGLEIDDEAKFSEGLLGVYSRSLEAWGYINKSFEFVVKPKFRAVAPFSEGLAKVAVLENGEEKVGFIDHSGSFTLPPSFNTDFNFRRNASHFSEGLAALSEGLRPSRTSGETFVYIDKTGRIVLETQFFYASAFHEGLASVYDDKSNRWGFIDRTGKVVIPLRYQVANDFSEGLALLVN